MRKSQDRSGIGRIGRSREGWEEAGKLGKRQGRLGTSRECWEEEGKVGKRKGWLRSGSKHVSGRGMEVWEEAG